MKIKKMFYVLSLVTVLMFGNSISTLAAEVSTEEKGSSNFTNVTEYTIEVSDEGVMRATEKGNPVDGIVERGDTMTLYPTLSSYVGISRKFQIFTTPMGNGSITPSGTIHVYLHNPSDTSYKYWTMTPDDEKVVSYTLPSSGTYTLRIESQANVKVQVNAGWMAN